MALTFSPRRLREARNDAGFSQVDAARLAGVGGNTVANAESGRWAPSSKTLAALADLYGVEIGWLFVAHGADDATGETAGAEKAIPTGGSWRNESSGDDERSVANATSQG